MFELARYYADVVGDAQLVWQMRNNDQLRGAVPCNGVFHRAPAVLGVCWPRGVHAVRAQSLRCRAPCLVRVLATARPRAGHAHAHVPADGAFFATKACDLHGAVRGGAKTDGGLNRVAAAVAHPTLAAYVRVQRQPLRAGYRGPVLSVLQGNPALSYFLFFHFIIIIYYNSLLFFISLYFC